MSSYIDQPNALTKRPRSAALFIRTVAGEATRRRAESLANGWASRWVSVLSCGYLGLHCAHELVGRRNRDPPSTKLDWFVALVDEADHLVARAYLGATNQRWECPVHGPDWDSLVASLADEFVRTLFEP